MFCDILIFWYLIWALLCHSCGFACQQRVLKTFPGPGYLRSEDRVVWLWHSLANLYICIYIYIYKYIYYIYLSAFLYQFQNFIFYLQLSPNRSVVKLKLVIVSNNFNDHIFPLYGFFQKRYKNSYFPAKFKVSLFW